MKSFSNFARIFFQPFHLEGRFRQRNFTPGNIVSDGYGRKYIATVTGALRRVGADGNAIGRDISQPRLN